jgi:catechol 2,3-dioxygenase-like lactoylglutathione lyase family enzyme
VAPLDALDLEATTEIEHHFRSDPDFAWAVENSSRACEKGFRHPLAQPASISYAMFGRAIILESDEQDALLNTALTKVDGEGVTQCLVGSEWVPIAGDVVVINDPDMAVGEFRRQWTESGLEDRVD